MAMDELQRSLGVTRVARVTGLDRAGIEVACAVRPGGHVLQVCNGKGLDWETARASALGEAAELWAAERVNPGSLLYGGRGVFWPDAGELVEPRLAGARIAWRRARDLISGDEVLVPAQAVHCPPPGTVSLGPAAVRWSSNGMGAHPELAQALRHALLEAAERDQVARALPQGFTPRVLRTRKLDPLTLPRAVQALVEKLEGAGLSPVLFDLSGVLAVAAALLIDTEQGPLPLTAGYACGLAPEEALLGALLEAAQSRLTDVHGAREDVTPFERGPSLQLARAASRAKPARSAARMPRNADALDALRASGFSRVAAVELEAPLHVVKVLIPGAGLA